MAKKVQSIYIAYDAKDVKKVGTAKAHPIADSEKIERLETLVEDHGGDVAVYRYSVYEESIVVDGRKMGVEHFLDREEFIEIIKAKKKKW